MGLRAVEKVRFARGRARTSPWWVIEHREIDPAPLHGEFELVIMIEFVTEEMRCMGSDRVPDPETDASETWLD